MNYPSHPETIWFPGLPGCLPAPKQQTSRAAAKYRRETKAFEADIQGGFTYLITLDDVTGSQDEVASKAGAATVK